MCVDYLKNPSEAVETIKEEAFLEKSLGVMAVAALVIAVDTVIGLNILSRMSLTVEGPGIVTAALEMGRLNLAVAAFFTVFLGGLFFGWITKIIMNLLGGEGGYFEGLTTIAYPVLAATVGILLAMVFSYVPVIGNVISFIVIAVFFAISYASMYRFAKELFDTGMIEAFVGISVLFAIVMVSIYGSLATTASGLKAILPSV